MRSRTQSFGSLVIGLIALVVIPANTAQRWCSVPCGHRVHPYDVGPCSHPCLGPFGPYACHPAGDTYPCAHPLHPWDSVPC